MLFDCFFHLKDRIANKGSFDLGFDFGSAFSPIAKDFANHSVEVVFGLNRLSGKALMTFCFRESTVSMSG